MTQCVLSVDNRGFQNNVVDITYSIVNHGTMKSDQVQHRRIRKKVEAIKIVVSGLYIYCNRILV